MEPPVPKGARIQRLGLKAVLIKALEVINMKMKVKLILVMLTVLLPAHIFAATVTLDGTWYTGSPDGTPSLSDPNSDSFIWGTDGSATESAQKGALWSYFSGQALVEDGDSITLSFTVTPIDATATAYDFRFGLFNSGGTKVLNNLSGANTDDGFLDTLGYFSQWRVGSESSSIELFARTAGKTSPVSSTSDVVSITRVTGFPNLTQGTAYDITLTITRNSATEYLVISKVNGVEISGTTTTINANSFDTVALQNTPTGIDSFEFTGFNLTTEQLLVIQDQPEDTFAFEGDPASFTVSALNPFTGDETGLSYQWYQGQPGDANSPVGTDSATYTIPSVAVSDKGSYYCKVTLTADGQTLESQPASLVVRRLLAHYAFDGDLLDSAGTNDGTPVDGGPDFEPGVINQAAKFYGDRYMDIGTDAYPAADPNYRQSGLDAGTISFWLNSTSTTDDAIMGSLNAEDDTMINMPFTSNNRLRLAIRDKDGRIRSIDIDTNLRDGSWHYVVFTYTMGPQSQMKAYVDGEAGSVIVSQSGNPQSFTAWENPIYIGIRNNRGTASNAYYGNLDDLRIYNYPLSAIEVATYYADITGESVCVEPPAYDYDGDCRVTAADLTYIAAEWLDCGMVPTCQ